MTRRTFSLNGNQLKIFALICMTLDHVGFLLLPQYRILRYIGRLSMPIFAWMIAEGCRYTKNKFLYLFTMASVAFVCQMVMWIVNRSFTQCILVTFSLSIATIYAIDFAKRKKGILSYGLVAVIFCAIVYVCYFLPKTLPTFHIDYQFFGIMLPVVVYLAHERWQKLLAAALCLICLALTSKAMQWYSLLCLPFLFLYNGTRGKARLKYLFYIYYPLHLAVLYGIAYLL